MTFSMMDGSMVHDRLALMQSRGTSILVRKSMNPIGQDLDRVILDRLISDRTYAEIALRAYEYIQYSAYKQEYTDQQPEVYCIAEVTWFNCLCQLLTDLGMVEAEASQFCDNDDNLLELALRIQSVTGYGLNPVSKQS